MAAITLRWGENPITNYKKVAEDSSIVLIRPDRNFGNQPFLYINQGSRESRTLIKFDLQELGKWISSVDDITSASLKMYVDNADVDSVKLNIRRIKKLWNQGNKNNNDAIVGQVTWNSQSYGDSTSDVPWSVAGCKGGADRNNTIEDSITLDTTAEGTWITFDVTTAVKYSYTTGLFYGFVIEHLSGNGNQIAFKSSSNSNRRPYLEVVIDGQSSSSSSRSSSSSSTSSSRSSSSSSRSSSSSSSTNFEVAGQDFTNWSIVDASNILSITPTRITFTELVESENIYAYYDFGAGFFDSTNLEIEFAYRVTAVTWNDSGFFFGLSNSFGTKTAIETANTGLGLFLYENFNFMTSSFDDYASAQTDGSVVDRPVLALPFYYTLYLNGTDAQIINWTTDSRSIVASQAFLSNVGETNFRYLVFGNIGAGATDWATGYLEDFTITNRGV